MALDDRAASATDRRMSAEHAAVEAEVAAGEARAWRLLQALPDPVVVADAHGIIELINVQAVALFFGYRADELVGQPVELLILSGSTTCTAPTAPTTSPTRDRSR